MGARRCVFRIVPRVVFGMHHLALTALLCLGLGCAQRVNDPSPAARELMGAARVLEHGGDWSAAVARLEQAGRVDPASPHALLEKGRLLERMGFLSEAVAAYEEAARRAPKSALPYLRIAALYEGNERPELARASIIAAAAEAPNDPDVLVERGRLHLEDKELWLAASNFSAAIRAQPALAAAFYLQGRLEHGRHADGVAEAALKRALEIQPGHVDAALELSELYRELSQPGRALACLESLQSVSGGALSAAVARERANVERALGRQDRLDRYLTQQAAAEEREARLAAAREAALWLAPQELARRRELGALYLAAGDGERAEGVYRGILHLAPDDVPAWKGVARSILARGDNHAAARALEQVLERDPADEGARAELAALRTLGPSLGVGSSTPPAETR